MPCDSRITNTQMVDADQLKAAIEALGGTITEATKTRVTGKISGEYVSFDRSRADAKVGFQTTMTNVDRLQAIQRKYSEIGVRTFAKRKGYTVQQEGNRFTLINRRGGK